MADGRDISGASMTSSTGLLSEAALARLERELKQIKAALGLLGAKPCSVCGRYYLSANAGNLFHAGDELVCYACLSHWWGERCPELSVHDRGVIEHKLMRWLVEYHNAQVYRVLKDLPPSELQEIHLIVACPECDGTGQLAGERCRHCLGNRNVWVITLKDHSQPL
jgi:hypothetical protein